MMSFFLTLVRFFKAIFRGFKDPEFRALFFFIVAIILSGTLFYHYFEGWKYLDSVYFSVATLTTVGYGDFYPHTDIGKIFTIFYIIIGIGTMLSFITALARHTKKETLMNYVIKKTPFDSAVNQKDLAKVNEEVEIEEKI